MEERVIELVKRGAEMIRGAIFEVTKKGDASNIVTSSDLAVQRFLVESLGKLLPSAGFYCEEGGLKYTTSEYVWVIDPIDGTTNYSRGINECAISVGLVHNGRAELGVVVNVFTGEVYSATLGKGARCNGKSIRVSNRRFEEGLLCTALCLYRKDLAKTCADIMLEAHMSCNDIRRFGSCAIELCYLAAGKCDAYFEIRVYPWDYAGGKIIIEEAGGILTGFKGEELRFDKPTVLIGANSEENHGKLRAIVEKYMDKVPYEDDYE